MSITNLDDLPETCCQVCEEEVGKTHKLELKVDNMITLNELRVCENCLKNNDFIIAGVEYGS